VLLYPVYALLFADAGLSTGQLSSLFVIWSITTFVLEIPSGAWADAFSRRGLLALGGLLRATGFALWVLFPSYPAFVAGFLLWGISSAMESGTLQALVYDELAALNAADRYTGILGRSETLSLVAMLGATALAAPAYAVGGYGLVGAASVAVCLASAVLAWSLPERPRPRAQGSDGLSHYLHTLRAGLSEVRAGPRVLRAVALAAAVPALAALDEYLPLLARAMGAATVAVPLLLLLPTAAMAIGSGLAGRLAGASPRAVAVALTVGAVLLAAGAVTPHPTGMLAVAGFFAVMQYGMVLTDARLQETITGPARATVTSVAGFGSEVISVAIYLGFAAGSLGWDVPLSMALCAGPVLGLALLIRRWLPPHRAAGTP
jgi:predicted MFS family arabinose efflux permease